MPHPGRHDAVRGNGQGGRRSHDTSRNHLSSVLGRMSDDSRFIVITEDQNRASHSTGVAIYARHFDLVGPGGRDGESGFYLLNAWTRSIGAHARANDRPLSTR